VVQHLVDALVEQLGDLVQVQDAGFEQCQQVALVGLGRQRGTGGEVHGKSDGAAALGGTIEWRQHPAITAAYRAKIFGYDGHKHG
jgi:hypothetical protein